VARGDSGELLRGIEVVGGWDLVVGGGAAGAPPRPWVAGRAAGVEIERRRPMGGERRWRSLGELTGEEADQSHALPNVQPVTC
jgi:hypothetical protein